MRKYLLVVVLLVLAQGCGTSPKPAAQPVKPISTTADVVAHRGGKPENTLSAFKKALADPDVDIIEMDVQVSRDGELFVMHDPMVDRTTDGKGSFAELSAAHIRELKTPKGGTEPVPTLDDVMALLAGAPGKKAFVEIKEPTPPDTAAKVLATLKKHGVAARCIVTSFDQSLVDATRKLDAGQAVGFVSKGFGNMELSYPAEYLLITYGMVTPEKLAEAHKGGKKVYVWTVNDKPIMENYLRMGVDGIISDEYRLVAEVQKQ